MNSTLHTTTHDKTKQFAAAGRYAMSSGKRGSTALSESGRLAVLGLAITLELAIASNVQASPAGGSVTAGTASIATGNGTVTISQSSQSAAINWKSFSIHAGESTTFLQPNSNSVALNRVVGSDPSSIAGSLTANGKVFLVNPNGVLFTKNAQVTVGGLVASTLDITDSNFMAGSYKFAGTSSRAVVNRGTINATGGYVALLGADVSNKGAITARLGTVVLAAGSAVTLDVAGDGLLNVTVDKGALNASVKNGGVIRASGGKVILTAQAAGQLLKSVVNNTGVIEAQTIGARNGTISLLGDMQNGTVKVSGTLDASAPHGGNGGFIETSAAHVKIAKTARITTAARQGTTGTWSIDPVDFAIGSGGDIAGSTLSTLLVTNSVTITTLASGTNATVAGTPPVTSLSTTRPGNGDITVTDAISWTASPSTTTLTLNAARDVNVNNAITATNGNFVACCGRDINVSAAVSTTSGSVLLSAGRNLNLNAVGAMTTTDGNLTLCAADNINVASALTLTRGSSIPSQSLGLAPGLVFIAGNGGTGPGVNGGTLIFAPLAPPVTVTGPNAPTVINYNPISYSTPTDYSGHFTFTGGAALTEHKLVFPNGDKVFDGTTATTLSGFKSTVGTGFPSGVTLVAGPDATADFVSPDVGSAIGIKFRGYSLSGPEAAAYALAANCCTALFSTSGAITVAPPVVTPPVVTPVVTPPVLTPVVTPPVVTPVVVTLPVATPPVVTPVVTPSLVAPPVVTQPIITLPTVPAVVVTPAVVASPVGQIPPLTLQSGNVTPPLARSPIVVLPVTELSPVAAPIGTPTLVILSQGITIPPSLQPFGTPPVAPPAPEYAPKHDRN